MGGPVQGPNSIIYYLYPFFFWVFYGISLSYPHTLLSISFVPLLAKGWGMAPRGDRCCGQGRGKGMRIPEFLSPGGGTGTRSKLNYLLYLPFFIIFFYGISLSLLPTLLYIYPSSLFWTRYGVCPRGEMIAVEKGGERE